MSKIVLTHKQQAEYDGNEYYKCCVDAIQNIEDQSNVSTAVFTILRILCRYIIVLEAKLKQEFMSRPSASALTFRAEDAHLLAAKQQNMRDIQYVEQTILKFPWEV